jgi:hypothetical protein
MGGAIDFNNELRLTTDKVSDERTDWCLAEKLGAGELAVAELLPQAMFGQCAITPELARDTEPCGFTHRWPPSPPRALRGSLPLA